MSKAQAEAAMAAPRAPAKPTCANCRHWWTRDDTVPTGWCRRFPPAMREIYTSWEWGDVFGREKKLFKAWPVTLPSDCCGEHQPNENP